MTGSLSYIPLRHSFSPFSLCQAECKEYARQSRASEEVMRGRVEEVRDMVHEEELSKKEIASGNCAFMQRHTIALQLAADACLYNR